MESKKKSKSVTYEQKQLLIDFVHKHPKLNTKKFGPSFSLKDSHMLWQSITNVLNQTIGPKKSWVEWRKCFQYLKSAAKQKVPSKTHYNKTGGGEKQDGDTTDQADEQLLDILGDTAIHGHESITESTAAVSFLSNVVDEHENTLEVSLENDQHVFEELISVGMPEEEVGNLDYITICDVNLNKGNEQDEGAEKEIELDPFDGFMSLAKKRSWDKAGDADSQNSHNKSIGKKTKLTNTALATEKLGDTTARMLELKAMYYKEKLKLKLRDVEAKEESIAENLNLLISKLDNKL